MNGPSRPLPYLPRKTVGERVKERIEDWMLWWNEWWAASNEDVVDRTFKGVVVLLNIISFGLLWAPTTSEKSLFYGLLFVVSLCLATLYLSASKAYTIDGIQAAQLDLNKRRNVRLVSIQPPGENAVPIKLPTLFQWAPLTRNEFGFKYFSPPQVIVMAVAGFLPFPHQLILVATAGLIAASLSLVIAAFHQRMKDQEVIVVSMIEKNNAATDGYMLRELSKVEATTQTAVRRVSRAPQSNLQRAPFPRQPVFSPLAPPSAPYFDH